MADTIDSGQKDMPRGYLIKHPRDKYLLDEIVGSRQRNKQSIERQVRNIMAQYPVQSVLPPPQQTF